MITFENIHKNKTANIIGKGTSIKRLKLCDIKDGFIIAINQAVLKVEEIGTMLHVYSLQKDGSSPELRDDCYCRLNGISECPYEMVRPKRATLINHLHESPCCMEDYSPRIVFSNEDLGLEWMMPSALSAIKIAKYFGANKIRMIGIQYRIRVTPDRTDGQEGFANVRVCVIGARTNLLSTGVQFNEITQDEIDVPGTSPSVIAGDLTLWPLDRDKITTVYMDKHIYANAQYSNQTNLFKDQQAYKEGYIKINKVLMYPEVNNAQTYVPSTTERIYVYMCADKATAPFPIVEGHWRVIFEDMV